MARGEQRHEQQRGHQEEAKRLTRRLWSQLRRRAATFDDNCNIEYSGYSVMLRYLARWSNSIYTLLWIDVLLWCVLYTVMNLVYRLALNDGQKTVFEDLVRSVRRWSGEVPLTFLLGFFVSNVVTRWWDMYTKIPKVGGVSQLVRICVRNSNSDKGLNDPKRAEKIRKSIGRYLNLAWVLCIWQFSSHVRDRFHILRQIVGTVNEVEPLERREKHIEYNELYNFRRRRNDTLRRHLENIRISEQMQAENLEFLMQDLCLLNEDPIVKQTFGDLITVSEAETFRLQAEQLQKEENENAEETTAAGCCGRKQQTEEFGSGKQLYKVQWWLPLHWAVALVERSFDEGFVLDTGVYLAMTGAIRAFGGSLTELNNYATRSLPLVYTQVAIIAVYTKYIADTVSLQFLDPARAAARGISDYWLDYYVPVFGVLQVLFIIGWFKVALLVLDPFGRDDGDFLLGEVFNGNLRSSIDMCTSEAHLYPKKLWPILQPSAAKVSFDYLHSDAEDADDVILRTTGVTGRGELYVADSLWDESRASTP